MKPNVQSINQNYILIKSTTIKVKGMCIVTLLLSMSMNAI